MDGKEKYKVRVAACIIQDRMLSLMCGSSRAPVFLSVAGQSRFILASVYLLATSPIVLR